jgi:hypothetical protein
VSGQRTLIYVRTKGSYLYPDKGLVFVSKQSARICVRTKDSNLCPDKGLVYVSGRRFVFVSGQRTHICIGQRTRICVRTKDSYLCPDKGVVFLRATESVAFRKYKFAEAQTLREVLVLNLGTSG